MDVEQREHEPHQRLKEGRADVCGSDAQVSLLTTSEVAALTRAPEATVRYWRHLGTGPRSFKIGRRVVYRESDVMAWLEERMAADPSSGGRVA